MIFITGDTHGQFDSVKTFCERFETTKKDILIILGDVGINYYGNKRDIKLKEELSNLPITLFCIKGNHENYAGNISSYREFDYMGGKVFIEQEYPNLIFAKDGEVYNINGKKTIVIGGAYSVDKHYRLSMGYKWFSDEQPSEKTKKYVEGQLERENWEVDVVLSHTCPVSYEPIEWFLSFVDQDTVDKSTEKWLDAIEKRLTYKKWYCGHFHGEKTHNKLEFMFNTIKEFR